MYDDNYLFAKVFFANNVSLMPNRQCFFCQGSLQWNPPMFSTANVSHYMVWLSIKISIKISNYMHDYIYTNYSISSGIYVRMYVCRPMLNPCINIITACTYVRIVAVQNFGTKPCSLSFNTYVHVQYSRDK